MEESKQCLVVHNPACVQCGHRSLFPCTVELSSIISKEHGWELEGIGKLDQEFIRCPACAQMPDGVANIIPIECHSYHCPKCGQSDSLEYKVQKIEASGNDFLFEAQINCKKCGKKSFFHSVLKNILDLVKIELSPAGITIKKN